MPAVRRTTFMEIIWKLHRFIYRASGGRVGAAIGGRESPQARCLWSGAAGLHRPPDPAPR